MNDTENKPTKAKARSGRARAYSLGNDSMHALSVQTHSATSITTGYSTDTTPT